MSKERAGVGTLQRSFLPERPGVAVIGAGIAGLTAAWQLSRAGDVDVTVYEAAARPGGTLHTSHEDGYLREHACNGFLGVIDDAAPGADSAQAADAVALAGQLGVPMAYASPSARKRWIYRGGRLHALPMHPAAFLTSRLVSLRGKLAALGEPFRRARPGSEETVLAFATRRLGREVAEAIVAPFVTGVFAGDASELSLQAGFPTIAALEEQGGLVRGGLSRMRAARRAGKPRARPRLAAPVGGVQALVDALAGRVSDAIGERFCLATRVRALSRPASGSRGVLVEVLCDGDSDVRQRHHDVVVLAIPAHVAAGLLGEPSPGLAAILRGIPYVPAVVAHLGFARQAITHPLDGFGFLVVAGEPLRALGVVFESILWPDRAPADRVLVRGIYGGARDPAILDLGDDEIIAIARADLERALGPIASPPEPGNVVRWPRAIPQYTLGHRERVAEAENLAREMDVVLAGSAYHGVAVNSLVADAPRVVGAVRALLGLASSAVITLLVLVLVSCAAGGPAPDDGDRRGHEAQSDSSADRDAQAAVSASERAAGDRAAVPAGPATLEVTVAWPDAPAALRRPRGKSPCGGPRPAALVVHTLGGVKDAVVWLDALDADLGQPAEPASAGPDAEEAAGSSEEEREGEGGGDGEEEEAGAADPSRSAGGPARLVVRACRLEPRVLVELASHEGLVVQNDDEARQRISVRRVAGGEDKDKEEQGSGKDAPLADFWLPMIGSRVALSMPAPGIWRVTSTIDPREPGYLVIARHGHAAATDGRGVARLPRVPPGRYQLVAWHPPVSEGKPALETRQAITIANGETQKITLALSTR